MNVLINLILHIFEANNEDKTRLFGNGPMDRSCLFDDDETTSGYEYEMSGVFNWRTGRFDDGTDPIGDYDEE